MKKRRDGMIALHTLAKNKEEFINSLPDYIILGVEIFKDGLLKLYNSDYPEKHIEDPDGYDDFALDLGFSVNILKEFLEEKHPVLIDIVDNDFRFEKFEKDYKGIYSEFLEWRKKRAYQKLENELIERGYVIPWD